MSYNTLNENLIQNCKEIFDEMLDQADLEKERDYLTYEELEKALALIMNDEFKHKNVFFKLVSEIETQEPNKIKFLDFLDIYQK